MLSCWRSLSFFLFQLWQCIRVPLSRLSVLCTESFQYIIFFPKTEEDEKGDIFSNPFQNSWDSHYTSLSLKKRERERGRDSQLSKNSFFFWRGRRGLVWRWMMVVGIPWNPARHMLTFFSRNEGEGRRDEDWNMELFSGNLLHMSSFWRWSWKALEEEEECCSLEHKKNLLGFSRQWWKFKKVDEGNI